MHKKVLIILPYKVDSGATEQQIDFVYQTYIKKLVNRNILPILTSSLFSHEMIDQLYDQSNGVILLGGSDIDPQLYSQSINQKTKVLNPIRDEIEKYIIERVIKDKKPLIGICRGMQIVNVILGGSLFQHLPDVFPDEDHMVPDGSSYDDVASFRGQSMVVLDNTRLSSMIGAGIKPVHCAHHQAIDKVANSLRINAKSKSGVIEGLESRDDSHFLILLENHIETQNTTEANAIWDSFSKFL